MGKRRLLWQLYPSYVIIALLAVVGLGWFAAHWFESYYLQAAGDELAVFARSIEERIDGEHINRLAGDRPVALAEACRSVAHTTGAAITVFDSSASVVCETAASGQPIDRQRRLSVSAALSGEQQSWVHGRFGEEERTGHVCIPVVRRGKVIGAVEASRSLATFDAALAEIRRRIALMGLAIAGLAAVLSPLVARRVTQPVEEMRKAAERFAHGDLDYKLPVPEAEELAGLANALNLMARQLTERIGTIVRQNNEQQAVLGSMVEGVLAVDNQQRVISLNKAAADLLSIDQLQAQGRSLQEVVRNADLRRFITRALSCDEPIDDDVVLHGDHEAVLQARGAALHDGQGFGIGAVVVLNDVTEFRRLEHIRRDFVANVSHELKTPITSIKGFVETLLDGAVQNPVDAKRFLQIVAKQAERLNSIIEDLLSLSKIEQGEEEADFALEPGSVRELLEAAVHGCHTQAADRGIHVHVSCPDYLLANLNAPLLEEAVINLLDNAIKYSEAGKEIHISAAEIGGEVQIQVSDRGCGIPAEHLPRIFERFYRVDKARSRKAGGTGLGLAIVKHIVQAHRGRVVVKSTPGAGSVFTILLPAISKTIPRPASLAG